MVARTRFSFTLYLYTLPNLCPNMAIFSVFWSIPHLYHSCDTVYTWLQTYTDTNMLKFRTMEGKRTHVCYKHLHRPSCVKRLLLSSCTSVRPSIGPHVPGRLPLDGFTWNLVLTTFMKICQEIPNCLKIQKKIWHFAWRIK